MTSGKPALRWLEMSKGMNEYDEPYVEISCCQLACKELIPLKSSFLIKLEMNPDYDHKRCKFPTIFFYIHLLSEPKWIMEDILFWLRFELKSRKWSIQIDRRGIIIIFFNMNVTIANIFWKERNTLRKRYSLIMIVILNQLQFLIPFWK